MVEQGHMRKSDLDQLRDTYKKAIEEWIRAIRAEESIATPDHTTPDVWEHAGFTEEEARAKAKEARRNYEDALRKLNFNF